MLGTLDAEYWTLELDAGDRILELVTWVLGVLDAEDTGCQRYWILEMPGVGAGDACCFIIVCYYLL